MWIIVLIAVAVAFAARGSGDNTGSGFAADDGCANVVETDGSAAMRHALDVMQANGWTAGVATRDAYETRLLAIVRAALPACANKVPDRIYGVPWSEFIDQMVAATPGFEGADIGQAQSIGALIRNGAPIEAQAWTIKPGATLDPPPVGFPPPPPPNAGGMWVPPGS